jgi:hypothetical protein
MARATHESDGAALPPGVHMDVLYVVRCDTCRATPDDDGGEFRKFPRQAFNVLREFPEWRLVDGVPRCPDCAAIECPDCEGIEDVSHASATPCERCGGAEIIYAGEPAAPPAEAGAR